MKKIEIKNTPFHLQFDGENEKGTIVLGINAISPCEIKDEKDALKWLNKNKWMVMFTFAVIVKNLNIKENE